MKIRFPENRPPGPWSQLGPLDVSVAGVQNRVATATAFARGAEQATARGHPFGLTLRREQANGDDANAVAVDGFWIAERRRLFRRAVAEEHSVHIGYLPGEIAAKVAAIIDAGEQVAADARSWYESENGRCELRIGIYKQR